MSSRASQEPVFLMRFISINLFAGPSAGKSIFASELFAALKKQHRSAEAALEVAKDMIRDGRRHALENQISIFGEQWHRLSRLEGQVEIAITDSPVLLCSNYAPAHYPDSFHELAWWCHRRFERINFFVTRQPGTFEEEGRVHSEEEAVRIDEKLKRMLREGGETFIELPSGEERLGIALAVIDAKLRQK